MSIELPHNDHRGALSWSILQTLEKEHGLCTSCRNLYGLV